MRVELLEYPGGHDWTEVYLVPMCEYAVCHEMKPCGRKSNVGE